MHKLIKLTEYISGVVKSNIFIDITAIAVILYIIFHVISIPFNSVVFLIKDLDVLSVLGLVSVIALYNVLATILTCIWIDSINSQQ